MGVLMALLTAAGIVLLILGVVMVSALAFAPLILAIGSGRDSDRTSRLRPFHRMRRDTPERSGPSDPTR